LPPSRWAGSFGNGGLGNGGGRARLDIGGTNKWFKTKNHVGRHSGWFYRVVLAIDFLSGTVTVADEHECNLPTDCPY
jgi:hypothetical protein